MDLQHQNNTLQVAQQSMEDERMYQEAEAAAAEGNALYYQRYRTILAQTEALERIADSLETIAQVLWDRQDGHAHAVDGTRPLRREQRGK